MLTSNYFTLFALPEQYALSQEKLKESYLKLQQQVHPDRFIEMGAHAKRLAVDYAAHINLAYQSLRCPILRAKYLLKQKGFDLPEEMTSLSVDFLMEQMELREKLVDSAAKQDVEQLEKIKSIVSEKQKQLYSAMEVFFKPSNLAVDEIKACIHKMQFYTKLEEEIQTAESTWRF